MSTTRAPGPDVPTWRWPLAGPSTRCAATGTRDESHAPPDAIHTNARPEAVAAATGLVVHVLGLMSVTYRPEGSSLALW